MPIQESHSSRYAMNQAKYPRGMCGIQVQKDESTIKCESDCMHTHERCGEGGADDTVIILVVLLISPVSQCLDANKAARVSLVILL